MGCLSNMGCCASQRVDVEQDPFSGVAPGGSTGTGGGGSSGAPATAAEYQELMRLRAAAAAAAEATDQPRVESLAGGDELRLASATGARSTIVQS